MSVSPSQRKSLQREARHRRIRAKIKGTSERPRLSVYKSNTGVYVQLIDDVAAVTMAAVSSLAMKGSKLEAATKAGAEIAKKAKELKISKVVFDRGGFLYTGRIKALADSAREGGLEF